MTCKFMLMKYLTERKDYKEATELTRELIEEIDLNSSPVLLQDFARTAKITFSMGRRHPRRNLKTLD